MKHWRYAQFYVSHIYIYVYMHACMCIYIYIHMLYVCSYLGNIMTATINHSDPHMKVVGRGVGQVFGLRVAFGGFRVLGTRY